MMPYMVYLGSLIARLQSLVAVTRPEQLTLFTSLLPDPHASTLAIRLPIAALPAYLVFAFHLNIQLYTFEIHSLTNDDWSHIITGCSATKSTREKHSFFTHNLFQCIQSSTQDNCKALYMFFADLAKFFQSTL